MNSLRVLLFLVLSLAATGCGPAQTTSPTSAPVLPTEKIPAQDTPSAPTPADQAAQDLIQKAKTDLAQRLSVPEDQINFIEVSSVTWSDGSLGCPKPGVAYIQMLVTGYLVILESGGTRYEYHADDRGNISYCQNPSF